MMYPFIPPTFAARFWIQVQVSQLPIIDDHLFTDSGSSAIETSKNMEPLVFTRNLGAVNKILWMDFSKTVDV
jgi:hypothetical protein